MTTHSKLGICKEIWPNGVYPKRESKMQLRDVIQRSLEDTPIKSYGQKLILGNFTMYIPLSTSDGWPRGIYGSINLKKIMKPSFDQPKNISDDWTRNPIFLHQAIKEQRKGKPSFGVPQIKRRPTRQCP